MRFLADESCDYAVVRALRELGHEVLAVADLSPGADDDAVIGLALRERCVLLTEDKDFGSWCMRVDSNRQGSFFCAFPPAPDPASVKRWSIS